MQSRLIKLQALSKIRNALLDENEVIRQASLRQDEERRRAESIEQLIQKVPLRFRGKTFDDYQIDNDEQAKIKKIAERYVKTFSDRLALGTPVKFMGMPGTGKTLLSLIICQALARAGFTVRYETSLEFISKLLAIRFKSSDDFQSHFQTMLNTQLFIMDEVTESIHQSSMPSVIEKKLLFKIIDARYENKLCTLIISNQDSQTLEHCLGKPTVERLTENGISLAFNWASYRNQ